MRAMAVRLIKDQDPVMVIFGHYKDWAEEVLYWKIDECADPNQCEYLEFYIDLYSICFMWPTREQDIDDPDLAGSTLELFDDAFNCNNDWTEINIEIDYK